ISTVAGNGFTGYSGDGGPAIDASVNGPRGVTVDTAGDIFIADTGNNRIREITPDGVVNTVAGTGVLGYSGDGAAAVNAELASPADVVVDAAGNLFIVDGDDRIREVLPGGAIITVAGNGTGGYAGDNGPATGAQLNSPTGIAEAANGNLYAADSGNDAIRMLQPSVHGIGITAITNAADNVPGPVAPGEIVVLYGSGLGPAQLAPSQLTSDGRVDTTAGGAQVYFNATPAPILYASATQTAAIVPYSITGSQVPVVAQYQGQTSAPVTLTAVASDPALFTLDSSGQGQAAALNQDGSVNGAGNPAPVGSFISLYATGEGQTSPPGVDGLAGAAPLAEPVLKVTVTIGGEDAPVQYAGGAPGLVAGVMQINAQLPSDLPPGATVPVVVTVGANSSQTGVTIAVSGN
ncbi:MAG: hypothetical protein ACRD2O_16400, partial [Terriglobia bacterium]